MININDIFFLLGFMQFKFWQNLFMMYLNEVFWAKVQQKQQF